MCVCVFVCVCMRERERWSNWDTTVLAIFDCDGDWVVFDCDGDWVEQLACLN